MGYVQARKGPTVEVAKKETADDTSDETRDITDEQLYKKVRRHVIYCRQISEFNFYNTQALEIVLPMDYVTITGLQAMLGMAHGPEAKRLIERMGEEGYLEQTVTSKKKGMIRHLHEDRSQSSMTRIFLVPRAGRKVLVHQIKVNIENLCDCVIHVWSLTRTGFAG